MTRANRKPNVFITCGSNAWERHKIRLERIVLPPAEDDPAVFDWSFMRGLAPTIIGDDCNSKTLGKLTWLLLRAGCPLVLLFYTEQIGGSNIIRSNFYRL